ncbi:acyltransferase family protein [Jeotgalibacillus malaysiensis]|uniref:acyltransferase family protein n=1 Tax=Jeotgalibacillus malaysiensis TaxID=1508404 RepID=UPI00384B319A
MRKHYFDNGKAIASFLGILYHSALVFSGTVWLISVDNKHSIPFLQYFTESISLFRMPLFLFISGYFAALSVRKYNLKNFTLNKLTRLGIPLVATLLTFNIIERIYILKHNNENFTVIDILNALIPWNSQFQLSHLWFLYYVMIFSFLIYFVLNFKSYSINRFFIRKAEKYIDTLLIACNVGILGTFGVLFIVTGYFHELINFLAIGTNLPYFLLGVITYQHWDYFKKLFIELSRKRLIIISMLLVFSFVLAKILSDIIPNSNTILYSVPRYFSLILVLGLLYKFLNKSNRFLRYMSESSYSIYLIHQPIIVVVSYYYVTYANFGNPFLGYLVVLLLSTFIVYTTDYLLIRKTKLGLLLFTGKTNMILEKKKEINDKVSA